MDQQVPGVDSHSRQCTIGICEKLVFYSLVMKRNNIGLKPNGQINKAWEFAGLQIGYERARNKKCPPK